MVAFLVQLYEHIQSVFEYNRMKYGGRDLGPSLGSIARTLFIYFVLFCILHAAVRVYWEGQPLSLATAFAALYHAVHYNVFVLLHLLLGTLRLLGVPVPA